MAAARAPLQAGRDEDLHLRLGADHGADVAPVEHRARLGARRGRGEAPLEAEKRVAHARHDGHDRGGLSDRLAAQPGPLQVRELERPGRLARRRRLARVGARGQHGRPHGAVQHAGVQIGEVQRLGQAPGQRPLAGRARPVDGDDHGAPASLWSGQPPWASMAASMAAMISMVSASAATTCR